jgi:hypothetical protein
MFLDEQFSAHNILLTSIFTSCYFVVLLKQTCEVTSLSLPQVTQFQNSPLAIPQTVGRRFLTAEACVRAQNFPFGVVTKKLAAAHGFLLVFFITHQHPYTIAAHLHYDHRRRHIMSCLFSVFNWNICLCYCQEYQRKPRSVKRVSAYPKRSRFVSNFEHLYVFTWSDMKMVHNYTSLKFQWNYPSSFW